MPRRSLSLCAVDAVGVAIRLLLVLRIQRVRLVVEDFIILTDLEKIVDMFYHSFLFLVA